MMNDDGQPSGLAVQLGRLMEGMDSLQREVRDNLRPNLHEIKNKLAAIDNMQHAQQEERLDNRTRHARIEARLSAIDARHEAEDLAKTEAGGWRKGIKAPLIWFMLVIGTFGTISMAVVGGLSMYDSVIAHIPQDGTP